MTVQGQANIEVANHRKQTPLLLAISQGHTSLVELLVLKGCNAICRLLLKQTCTQLDPKLQLSVLYLSIIRDWIS